MNNDFVVEDFPVKGMSCAVCAQTVESVLKSKDGIKGATVNFANRIVTVTYDKKITNSDIFKKSIIDYGYELITDEVDKNNFENIQILELKKLKNSVIGSFIFSVPVFVMAMFFHHYSNLYFIELILTLCVLVFYGNTFFVNAFKQLKHLKANMDTLVALSTGISFIFSAFVTMFPKIAQSYNISHEIYFESAAIVISFVLTGRLLESKARLKTSTALKSLIELQPKKIIVIYNEKETEIDLRVAEQGMHIKINPGCKIPVDGFVVSGYTFIDESNITGEHLPSEKTINSKVYAGTLNQNGSIVIEATEIGNKSLLGQIIDSVKKAQGSKAPVQNLADKIAGIFVPIVILIAFISFSLWLFFGGTNYFGNALLSFVSILVIACPCALGLATPTAIIVGVGKFAQKGIIVKDASGIEKANKTKVVVFDKTGTLTEGKPIVNNVIKSDNVIIEEYLPVISSVAKLSEHPLSKSIASYCKNFNLQNVKINDFNNIPGKGIVAYYNNVKICIGNLNLINENNFLINKDFAKKCVDIANNGYTIVYVGINNNTISAFAISDKIKPESKNTITALKNKNINTVILTGDNKYNANLVCSEIGANEFKAELLPYEKMNFINSIKTTSNTVAMVGDGINDTQAMTEADFSIAMGSGSDITINIADFTIVSSNPYKIVEIIELSKKTFDTIKQNLFWAFIYNLIGIPVAAGLLFPIFGFMLNPMIASAAMALSSVSVVTNSLRIKYFN